MITYAEWNEAGRVRPPLHDAEIFVITPHTRTIQMTHRYGGWFVSAQHDGTDERGDIENLKTLCLIRFNTGESND